MIQRVSFGNSAISMDSTKKLSDELINTPNTYAAPTTVAAANVKGDKAAKKSGFGKTLAAIVVIAGTVAAALALGAKKLPKIEKAPEFLKNLFADDKILGKIGNTIANKASSAVSFVKNHLPKKAAEAVAEVVETVTEG